MIVLGIETSCDETAASVIKGHGNRVRVLSNIVSSQVEIHKKYGGVVPEVAAREHVLNILPVVHEALAEAVTPPLSLPLSKGEKERRGIGIDAIAVTVGPGLITSLMVGVETAKTLAYAWKLPVIAVNHIEGHIYANWLRPVSEIFNFSPHGRSLEGRQFSIFNKNKKLFPAVILTVSGGHTMLVLMTGHGKYKTIGETRDDAAGEAFDKAAQLLGLGYPGGPAVAAEAAKSQIQNPKSQTNPKSKIQNSKLAEKRIILPRPMINDKSFDFSFSGLKTALLYEITKDKSWKKKIPEYAAEFQQAVVDVLIVKTIKAAEKYNAKTVMLSGGVAANQQLRNQLEQKVKREVVGAKFLMPELKYCTDNAAMIASAGYFRAKQKKYTPWRKLKVDANLELR